MPNEIVLTTAEKRELFRSTASDPMLRAEFAAGRAEVILPLLDEQSTVRRIFTVEELAPGAQANYKLPFDDCEVAMTMPQVGQLPVVMFEGGEITVATFNIAARVRWQMQVAQEGRFQVAQRATQWFKNRLIAQEELCGWTMIKAHAAQITNTDQQISASGLDLECFNDILTAGEVLERSITDLYISPRRYSDVRRWVQAENTSDTLRDQVFSNKGLARVWDVNMIRVRKPTLVSDSKGYAFGQREGYTYGMMPIRENLVTYDDPTAILEFQTGFFGRENLGFAVLDDKALVELTFG